MRKTSDHSATPTIRAKGSRAERREADETNISATDATFSDAKLIADPASVLVPVSILHCGKTPTWLHDSCVSRDLMAWHGTLPH